MFILGLCGGGAAAADVGVAVRGIAVVGVVALAATLLLLLLVVVVDVVAAAVIHCNK